MSAGDPLDTLLVNFAGRDAQIPPDMRALSLEVMTGDPTDEHPAHLVVTVAVTPGAVELLQALVRSVPTAYVELAAALEDALRDAARRTHEDLTARADTLAQAQQAAGPSPERVPPTDPPPAASSSPPPLTALPGGRTSTPAGDSDPAAAARRPRPTAPAATTSSRPRPTARRSPFAGPPLRERILAELADLPSGQTLRSAELQRRCRASQASTDKALRGLADESRVLRVGTKGTYGYRLPTAGEAPAPTTNATRASGTASSTPPPAAGTSADRQRQDRQDQRTPLRRRRLHARRPDPRLPATRRPEPGRHLLTAARTARRRRAGARGAARRGRRPAHARRQIPGGALT